MRRRRQPKPLFWIALTAFVVLAALLANAVFGPASASRRKVDVTIPRGASIGRIARILQNRGIINSAAGFRVLARITGEPRIEAGTYQLSPNMPPGRILMELRSGSSIRLYRITIPEGFTLEQIAERAAAIPGLDATDFQRLAERRGTTFTGAFELPDRLEGYLFPDTYDFPRGTSDRAVIQAMLDNFAAKVAGPLANDLDAAARRGYGLRQVLTIASLVEREARVPTDQPLIAGVLYNRLKRKMPLQVDATVQYVVGHKERLLYSDLEVDSPYNTYKTAGLPPGPICSPGLPAIQAALHPARVPYLYYTANPDGTHTFTTTLDAHERATQEARAGARAHGG